MFADALRTFTLIDAFDILLVAFILYQVYRFARGTRALPMLWGIVVLALLYVGAEQLGFLATSRILKYLLPILPFAIVVIFQSTIRRALAAVGVNPLRALLQTTPSTKVDEIVLAVMTLAARRLGAFFVIEQGQGLRTYMETGIQLDARLSYDLLVNIFAPDTPLHDGAIVIQEDKVAAASCYLPLTLNPTLSRKFGTRHRAAIGITEETDAIAIVVSEESGTVSLAFSGEISENLDAEKLRNHLRRLLGEEKTS
ncbi:MAG: diadenylate cyclase CdaA [Acidobacteriota bacterium]|nr:MAG: diadenylate cyclase CdaA [Acidobacteriota bacterium]